MNTDTPWTKARRSAEGGNCVELRRAAATVQVRDSKDPAGPVLRLTDSGLAHWLDSARTGRLDHLLPREW